MNATIVLVTAANALYLASYAVRDILWLRVLTVIGALLLIPYYASQPAPLVASIAWSTIFIALNLYWIARLVVERRPVHLDSDEERLRGLSFPSLTPREARNLFSLGAWEDLSAGLSLVEHDNVRRRFSVIFQGFADVRFDSKKVAELGPGQFVGGIDLRSGTIDVDVILRTSARVMCWPRDGLQSFLRRRPDVALALERSVGFELQHLLGQVFSQLDRNDAAGRPAKHAAAH